MTAREKVAALRKLMKTNKVDAYYVPSADPHQSEYLPEAWKLRAWLSGFTGSAGELVVGASKAGLWTDGRYYLQASIELAGSGIDLMKMGEPTTPTMEQFVAAQLRKGQVLGMDPSTVSVATAARFEAALAPAGIKVKFLAANLVAKLWTDRPEPSLAPVVAHSVRFAGEKVRDKMRRVRAEMADAGCKVHVVCALDQVAWLLNIRSRDVLFTPVATAYVVLTDKAATLYVDPRKMVPATAAALRERCVIKPYDAIWKDLAALGKRRQTVWIDEGATNRRIVDALKGSGFHFAPSPITALKAVKNPVQIKHIKAAHVRDGVAMVKFLKWLEGAVRRGNLTEMSAAAKLTAFRAEGENYRDDSFATISGYAANGAIIHYSADEKSNAKLKPQGLYLIDSGGQYLEGTTDITRTVALGKPTPRQVECFTRVLMGTIDCTRVPFPEGTTGQRQEMFARRALWLMGEDYAHGTGHGVGQYLGVHEGPHSLKNIPTPPLREGNLLSIEPGHYEAGGFGIRIENLAFVARDAKRSARGRTWLTFDTVTLCPIDRKLVDKKLMEPAQVAWLNAYHKRVYDKLSPLLDPAHRKWLKAKTKAI
ncbi:MAG TPA: aminopeptidase P family protein [Candidatus Krumholzibacteria bacterium]|nr:aminopeptidase P family protein [Candidatus Krumholzibacteria bacterium]